MIYGIVIRHHGKFGLTNFWNNKKVLITGHTGFKGIWLTYWLTLKGAQVFGVSLRPKKNKNFLYIQVRKYLKIDEMFFDITNKSKLDKSIRTFKPNIIFHLAAQAFVEYSYKNPYKTFKDNFLGTLNITNAALNTPSLKALINITSDKVYKNTNIKKSFDENAEIGGYDPYSSSKSCADLMSNCYIENFFLVNNKSIANCRSGNIIGGHDWGENRLIPDIINSIKKNKILSLRMPNATRPWQYILDPLFGYILLAEKIYTNKEHSGNYNFGPLKKNNIEVKMLVNKFYENANVEKKIVIENKKYKESKFLMLDSKKAKKKLNWIPKINLSESVKLTWELYNQTKPELIIKLMNEQITKYESKRKIKR